MINSSLPRLLPILAMLLAATMATPVRSLAAEHPHPSSDAAKGGALVMFVTNDDPMIAGHALHFAEHALGEGRRVTLILAGNAAKLALRQPDLPKSPVTGASLDHKLRELVAKKATVIVTPFSLAPLGAKLDDLIPGVAPQCDPALHEHMFEPTTKLMVW